MDTRNVNEMTVDYKPSKVSKFTVNSSKVVNDNVRDIFPVGIEHREAFVTLFLNRANKVIHFGVISIGGVSGTTVDPKIIFQKALLCNASGIVLVHNHPSGSLKPSESDIAVTKKIQKCANLLDIVLVDHLIITKDSYTSFVDENLI